MPNYNATLVSGRIYTLLIPNPTHPTKPESKTFTRNEVVVVSPAEKKLLDANAVDKITIRRGHDITEEERPKFTFEIIRDDPDTKKTRARPGATADKTEGTAEAA